MFISKIVPETLNRSRIDKALVELKVAKTRQNAQALIISGKVFQLLIMNIFMFW